MRVHYVRFGHANNSSSTHTVALLNPGVEIPATDEYAEFGWGFFTAADERSKDTYTTIVLAEAFSDLYGIPSDYARRLAASHTGVDVEDRGDTYGYVDHQSVPVIPAAWPRQWDDQRPSLEFFDAWRDEIMDPRVVVLGGNDNTDDTHNLLASGQATAVKWQNAIPEDTNSGSWLVRHDRLGTDEWWVLFDRRTGRKIRLTFGDKTLASSSPVPELVDLKVTNACPFETDCGFCYQGSTRHGDDADERTVDMVVRSLAFMGVFEIAFGGGEPTLWEPFWKTLAAADRYGVAANFTTKNLAWLNDDHALQTFLDHGSGVAFSVNDLRSLERTVAALETADILDARVYGGPRTKTLSLQLIPEVCGPDVVRAALDSPVGKVTLLGYKTTGRGNLYTAAHPNVASWLPDLLAGLPGWTPVGIDTVLARQIGDRMSSLAPRWAYETTEGRRSCYIDAVTTRMHTSSYDGTGGYSILSHGRAQVDEGSLRAAWERVVASS